MHIDTNGQYSVFAYIQIDQTVSLSDLNIDQNLFMHTWGDKIFVQPKNTSLKYLILGHSSRF